MATYGGWQELREYRVWASEDVWQVTTISKHRNGWYSVDTDGYDVPYKTRSEYEARECADQRTGTGEREAMDACPCATWDPEDREDCEDAARNVYGDSHGVRLQIVDMIENRTLDAWEL